ncbi:His Kinase A (phospho-acceptor) domain-containing protein [Belliella buryatensis]|uniref:histidine kinase n=1 Tax=Belliella buryatensis TaxID=1500549 RepID=A0A239AI60_9BACT|nr:ATP-binding protein [Belliella buryatensis]SNR95325.1 His Kinase A (phospho-acceptor) domain-containing protein [Belliella buryatensis]
MKSPKNIFKVGNKVALGFLLAVFLVISVSIVTFISIQNLLDTVENLSEPNQKLRQLNGLMADVYLLDLSKADRTSDKDSIFNEAYERIVDRIKWLNQNADNKSEKESFDKINLNIQELLVSYAGLEEIRYRLTNRSFSEEALKTIEIKIQRQKQTSELEFLGNLRRRDLFGESEIAISEEEEEILSEEDRENISDIVEELEALNLVQSGTRLSRQESDSVLVALKNLVTRLYKDEQELRENFIQLEVSLQGKNTEVFSEIQNLISNMQRSLLAQYREKNESAYNLTYNVSLILGGLVFLGVIGSVGFVYTILKEVRRADKYRLGLERAKQHSDDLAKAKQNFLANMSHEIRNPLHAIQGYQDLLKKTHLNEQQAEFVQMIGFASGTLMQIVNDILDFSKLEAGKISIEKQPFEGLQLFLAMKNFYSFKTEEKGLSFDWDIHLPKNHSLVGDQLRINQIMNNLLSNAIKFTEKGYVNVQIVYKDEKLHMTVKDSGIGISKEVKQQIFKEFNQGDGSITRKFGGTGLGLSIVKRLVDLQNGSIQVDSEQGMGTKIEISIPMELSREQPTNQLAAKHDFKLGGLRILIVDDDRMGLKLLQLLLESKGATVNSYLGGKSFKESYQQEDFDLALIDIQMPEIDGVEVLKLLQNDFRKDRNKVFAMTANVFADEQQQLKEKGFVDILLKPFDEEKLYTLLSSHLDSSLLNSNNSNVEVVDIELNIADGKTYDLSDMKKFSMGDQELFDEIMQDFISEGIKDIGRLKVCIEQRDFSKIREITHQLASRLGQIKSPLSAKAKEIEVALKNGQNEGMDDQTVVLISGMQTLFNNLKDKLNIEF